MAVLITDDQPVDGGVSCFQHTQSAVSRVSRVADMLRSNALVQMRPVASARE